jgi:hypothetical protein
VLVSFVYVVACRLVALVLLLGRSDGSKELEIVGVLRDELAILRRDTRRPQLTTRDRLVLAALSRGRRSRTHRSWNPKTCREIVFVHPTALTRFDVGWAGSDP